MKIYMDKNVMEAARERVSWLFDEFESVAVCSSGGKDSTVVLNLVMEEAQKRDRLPVDVIFIDQEAEWQGTVDYIKSVMYDERVNPLWLQVPIRLFNATSHESDNWLHCWGPGEKWMREKDPISIKENTFGTDRFHDMFPHFCNAHYDGRWDRVCAVSGVRAEESPTRNMSLTNNAKYKHVTWGNCGSRVKAFYPLYDWSYTDVWHAICENGWKYNRVYDEMYRLGVSPSNMRISNLNHETAVKSLMLIQEIEPNTWDRLTKRLYGVNTSTKIEYEDNFKAPRELPFMFRDWREYRDFLLDGLVRDPGQHDAFVKRFASVDNTYTGDPKLYDAACRVCVASILTNDYTFTKLHNFELHGDAVTYKKLRKGKRLSSEDMEKGGIRFMEGING